MDKITLDLLVCPHCKGKLVYLKSQQVLVCKADRWAFPIEDNIPVMLTESARPLTPDEEDAIS